jgi:hypothetical protein
MIHIILITYQLQLLKTFFSLYLSAVFDVTVLLALVISMYCIYRYRNRYGEPGYSICSIYSICMNL